MRKPQVLMNNDTAVYLQGNTFMSTENIAMGLQTPKAHQKSVFPPTYIATLNATYL